MRSSLLTSYAKVSQSFNFCYKIISWLGNEAECILAT